MDYLRKLSPKHLSMIETIIANPTITQNQLAAQFDLAQPNVSKIMSSTVFKEELANRLRDEWKGSVKIAQKTMIDLAKNGDYKASEYILNSNGYKPKEEIDLNNKVIQVTIEDD